MCRPRMPGWSGPWTRRCARSPRPCTSSTEARVIRKITANGIVASASAGRIRCLRASQAASHSRVRSPSRTKKPVTRVASMPESWRPETGSQCELDGEEVLEQEGQEEDRHGDADQRADHGQVVERPRRGAGRPCSRAGCRRRWRTRSRRGSARSWREAAARKTWRASVPGQHRRWRRRTRPLSDPLERTSGTARRSAGRGRGPWSRRGAAAGGGPLAEDRRHRAARAGTAARGRAASTGRTPPPPSGAVVGG